MNKHEKSVQQVEDIINTDREERIELEIAMQITEDEGIRSLYPGIQIHVPGSDTPVFISVGELQLLAEAANQYCTDIIEKKQKKSPTRKKTT